MIKSFRFGLLAAGTLAFCTVSASATAEEPGTSVATPPPAPTPTALSTPGAPLEVSPVPNTASTANEPMIDSTTTSRTLPNRPLIITGAIVLGGSYGASAIVAATSEREADQKLYYPVVGPWMDLADRGCDANPCSRNTLNQALLIGDGVLQGLGAVSILLSVMIPETKTRHWYLIGNQELVVAPQVGNRLTGLVAAGRF
jgi:hypothetical protein